jgi:flagellar FliJ protein
MRRFRLQKVLDARRILADRRQQELAAALRTLTRERRVLSEMEAEREAYRRQALALRPGPLDWLGEQALRAWIERLGRAAARQQQAIDHCEQRVAERRAALVQAMVDRKAIDKLRQRHRERERRTQEAMEQRETDEVARTAFARRPVSGWKARSETRQRESGT